MSEYQYYEFAAVDQPLSARQQAELRARSSRATITSGSFINEYHWGDLKGDPVEWMQHYFDAHLYSANWGHCLLMLKLPVENLDKTMLDACLQPSDNDAFEAIFTGQHCILTWSFNDEAREYDRFWSEDDGPGWLSRLLPLRQELLRGDTRPLYLGWLARLCAGELSDEDMEPPLPSGLATLTPAQQALVDFLEIDPDWLQAAAADSPAETTTTGPDYDLWLEQQSPVDLRAAVRLLLEGRTLEAERSLNRRFLDWQRDHRPQVETSPRRTVAQIATGYTSAREQRLERERRARARAEAKRLAERNARLAKLAADPDKIWQEMDIQLKRGTGRSYDQALDLAQSLADALDQAGRKEDFKNGLARLQHNHGKRPAWITRLKKAGLLD
jgi:hypothetical protein